MRERGLPVIGESPHLAAPEAITAAADDLAARGFTVVRPDADGYWAQHAEVVEESAAYAGAFPHLESLRNTDVVLGFLGRSHLGDVVCTSHLVRLLTVERGCRVFSVRHRTQYKVFENNPYLAGYRNENRIGLSEVLRGPGNITQQVARAFGFAPDPFPRGEIYLSDAEQRWAWALRASLPRNRPVAVLCAGSVTDNCGIPSRSFGWQSIVDSLASRFTVIQLAVTRMDCLEEVMRPSPPQAAAWRPDAILDNCIVLENLPVRRFFATFAVAGLYAGTNAGGAHVAAAFSVPSIIVVGARQYRNLLRFPNRKHGESGSFLYPHNTFVLSDSVG